MIFKVPSRAAQVQVQVGSMPLSVSLCHRCISVALKGGHCPAVAAPTLTVTRADSADGGQAATSEAHPHRAELHQRTGAGTVLPPDSDHAGVALTPLRPLVALSYRAWGTARDVPGLQTPQLRNKSAGTLPSFGGSRIPESGGSGVTAGAGGTPRQCRRGPSGPGGSRILGLAQRARGETPVFT